MLKARGGNVVLIGLSRMNVNKLIAGQPILFDGSEVDVPGIQIAIYFGETEEAMIDELGKRGLVGRETVVDDRRPDKKSGDHGD